MGRAMDTSWVISHLVCHVRSSSTSNERGHVRHLLLQDGAQAYGEKPNCKGGPLPSQTTFVIVFVMYLTDGWLSPQWNISIDFTPDHSFPRTENFFNCWGDLSSKILQAMALLLLLPGVSLHGVMEKCRDKQAHGGIQQIQHMTWDMNEAKTCCNWQMALSWVARWSITYEGKTTSR